MFGSCSSRYSADKTELLPELFVSISYFNSYFNKIKNLSVMKHFAKQTVTGLQMTAVVVVVVVGGGGANVTKLKQMMHHVLVLMINS